MRCMYSGGILPQDWSLMKRSRVRDKVIPEKQAVAEMKRIGVDPYGIKIMKDKAIFRLIRLADIRPAMANIIKEDMLSAGGEAAIHKMCCACKVDATDVLLMGTIAQYKHLLGDLGKQPYRGEEIAKRIKKLLRSRSF